MRPLLIRPPRQRIRLPLQDLQFQPLRRVSRNMAVHQSVPRIVRLESNNHKPTAGNKHDVTTRGIDPSRVDVTRPEVLAEFFADLEDGKVVTVQVQRMGAFSAIPRADGEVDPVSGGVVLGNDHLVIITGTGAVEVEEGGGREVDAQGRPDREGGGVEGEGGEGEIGGGWGVFWFVENGFDFALAGEAIGGLRVDGPFDDGGDFGVGFIGAVLVDVGPRGGCWGCGGVVVVVEDANLAE